MFMMGPMSSLMKQLKAAIKGPNKNSFPGPDRITPVLIQNDGENITKSLTILLQNC